MSFSKNLKDLRKKYNKTQKDLAVYLNVTRPTIAGYETKNKEPDFERLILISEYFDVTIDFLLKGSEKAQDIYGISEYDKEFKEVLTRLSNEDKAELLELAKIFYYRKIIRESQNSSENIF